MVSRVRLHTQGPEVSRFACGTWRLLDSNPTSQEIRSHIEACLDNGVTTFDHADIYGGYGVEAAFGAVLANAPGLRERMEIVTKCGIVVPGPAHPSVSTKHYDYSQAHIVASAEMSLQKLRTDRIDILLLHRPSPRLHPDEVAAAFDHLIQSGKVLHVGVSNFSPEQFDALASRIKTPLVTNQIEISLLEVRPLMNGALDHLVHNRIRPMAWSPTGGGRLFTSSAPGAVRVRTLLQELALKYDSPPAALAYAWLLALPAGPQIILGSGKTKRLREALAAESANLSTEDWFALLEASSGAPVP